MEVNKTKYGLQNYAAVVSSPPAVAAIKFYSPLNKVNRTNDNFDVNQIANNQIIINAVVKTTKLP